MFRKYSSIFATPYQILNLQFEFKLLINHVTGPLNQLKIGSIVTPISHIIHTVFQNWLLTLESYIR